MPAEVQYITPRDLAQRLRAQADVPPEKRPLVVYDVRDDDRTGGHIAQSTHVEAASMVRNAARYAAEAVSNRKSAVAFHCTFSQVRGPRSAMRFADALQRVVPCSDEHPLPAVFVLEGGFTAFAKLYPGNEDLFEKFNERLHLTSWEND